MLAGRLHCVSSRRRPDRQTEIKGLRSSPAVIAVAAWWTAALLAIAGWQVLNASMAEPDLRGLEQFGIWLVGFAALASVIGWGACIGSVLRDSGRVRAGALCLLLLPVLGLVAGWAAFSSTVLRPADPLMAAWLVASGLLLVIGTLLIVLPEHLGTN